MDNDRYFGQYGLFIRFVQGFEYPGHPSPQPPQRGATSNLTRRRYQRFAARVVRSAGPTDDSLTPAGGAWRGLVRWFQMLGTNVDHFQYFVGHWTLLISVQLANLGFIWFRDLTYFFLSI